MKKINNIKKGLLAALLTALFVNCVFAFPVLPSHFYGKIAVDGKYGERGTNISAYDVNGILCGSSVIEKKREYLLSCKGDNPETIDDEGAKENELVVFYINNKNVESNVTWHEGGFTKLNLALETKSETVSSITEYPSKSRIPPDTYLLIILFLSIILFGIIKIIKKQEGNQQ